MHRTLALIVALVGTALVPAFAATGAVSPLTDPCVAVTAGSSEAEECVLTGAQFAVGVDTFEPTMGAAPDGSLYFATTPGSGVAIGFGAGISRSTNGGANWKDISPTVGGRRVPVETNDPYIYVDPATGRAFEFHMSPVLTCSTLSFSDDGGATWKTNPVGCGPTGAWDHQTMVAAKPRVLVPVGYPNIVHQCVNAVYATMCSRSLDGGLTWSPSTPVHTNRSPQSLCGTQHGHLAAAPDGTLYLPTTECGHRPEVYVSEDDGLTWRKSVIAEMDVPFTDPTVGVDRLGNVYAAFVDNSGLLLFSVSRDKARTWAPPVTVTHDAVTATLPALTVGDPGRVAIAYPGTRGLPTRFDGAGGLPDATKNGLRWGGYFTVSTNALDASPRFETVEATGTDPLMRRLACASGGRCAYQVDFIEATVTPDGQPFASFADGCTSVTCRTKAGAENNEAYGNGVAVTVLGVDLCEARCSHFGPPPAG